MPDLFPTRAEFRAGLRRAAQRRRVQEARLFGAPRQAVTVPTSSVAPDLAEELDALAAFNAQVDAEQEAAKGWMHRFINGQG